MTLTPEQFNKITLKEDLKDFATHDKFEKRLTRIEKYLNLGLIFDY